MQFPLKLKFRRAEATIYGKKKNFPWYRLAYYFHGRRHLRAFKKLSDARKAAKSILRDMAKGSEAPSLSVKDARGAILALEELRNLGTALQLLAPPNLAEAVTEYVEAKRRLGKRRLIEAVDGYLLTCAQIKRVSVRQAADEYLHERELRTRPTEPGKRPSLSPKIHYQDLLRLNRFAKHFAMDVCDLGKSHFDLFFREHLAGLMPKSLNHYRATLRQWLAYCATNDYLPVGHRLGEAVSLKNETVDGGEIEIYTAADFSALLAACDPLLRPFLAIGGLAGLRTQEILRLEWSDVWRRPGYIEVSRGKAKTRQRRLVPICAALKAWLEPYADRTEGPVWLHGERNAHEYYREAAAASKVARKDNALRHSFITYRLAVTGNEQKVAQEAGTSPAMIHSHYRALATPEEAAKWFEVAPLSANENPSQPESPKSETAENVYAKP